jgi:hypothetical protein
MLVSVGRYRFLTVKRSTAIGGYMTLDVCDALFVVFYYKLPSYFFVVLLKVPVGVFLC